MHGDLEDIDLLTPNSISRRPSLTHTGAPDCGRFPEAMLINTQDQMTSTS